MGEIILVPSGSLAACLDTYLARRILFDEAEGKPVDDGQISRSMSLAHSAIVLARGNIKTPIQTIFDAPMVSDSFSKAFGITGQVGMKYLVS